MTTVLLTPACIPGLPISKRDVIPQLECGEELEREVSKASD